jgi:hypothetical protein
MTSRADSGEHAVMATELEQANRTGDPPVGLCGAVVDPAPLGLTARHVCRPCREAVARRRRGPHPGGHLPAACCAVVWPSRRRKRWPRVRRRPSRSPRRRHG